MWSDVVDFVQSIFIGSFNLFSQLASNSLLGKAFEWLICGFVIYSLYRFIIRPLTGNGASAINGALGMVADDAIRQRKLNEKER